MRFAVIKVLPEPKDKDIWWAEYAGLELHCRWDDAVKGWRIRTDTISQKADYMRYFPQEDPCFELICRYDDIT